METIIHISSAKQNWDITQSEEGIYYSAGFFSGSVENILKKACEEKFFESVNDNYAFVIDNFSGHVMAAVDHVRSIPLFYHYREGKCLYISDEPLWLKNKLSLNSQDEVSQTEFLFSGFTTGDKTLYSEIRQLQSGEYLIFDKVRSKLELHNHFQYKPLPDQSDRRSVSTMIEELYDLHGKIGKRLVDTLDGRRAVIPLSGGYDSRLVLDMLAREQYDNILTFTYGRRFLNWEADVSKQVAEHYQVPWHKEHLTRKDWYYGIRSESSREFAQYGHDLTSLAHLQDFLSVERMLENSVLKQDDVLIPGHAADFIEGSHIPASVFKKDFTAKDLYNHTLKKHFWMWSHDDRSIKTLTGSLEKYFSERLKIKPGDTLSGEKTVMAMDFFNWAERQSKYIVNSIRVYDFFNLEWRLPLWDPELVEFWRGISLELKFNRKLYLEYVNKYENFSSTEPFYIKGKWGKRLEHYLFNTLLAERYGRINGNKPFLSALFDKVTINDTTKAAYSFNLFDFSISHFEYLSLKKDKEERS